jgi:hypothetical protein
MGFELIIGFSETVQLVNTSTGYAVTVLHTSEITIGHTRSSLSVTVFTNRCLVAASNGELSPSSVGTRTVAGLSHQLLTARAHND